MFNSIDLRHCSVDPGNAVLAQILQCLLRQYSVFSGTAVLTQALQCFLRHCSVGSGTAVLAQALQCWPRPSRVGLGTAVFAQALQCWPRHCSVSWTIAPTSHTLVVGRECTASVGKCLCALFLMQPGNRVLIFVWIFLIAVKNIAKCVFSIKLNTHSTKSWTKYATCVCSIYSDSAARKFIKLYRYLVKILWKLVLLVWITLLLIFYYTPWQ